MKIIKFVHLESDLEIGRPSIKMQNQLFNLKGIYVQTQFKPWLFEKRVQSAIHTAEDIQTQHSKRTVQGIFSVPQLDVIQVKHDKHDEPEKNH